MPQCTRHTSTVVNKQQRVVPDGREEHVARHMSHVTRHTSHVTRRTSHVTRHTSHVITTTHKQREAKSPNICSGTRHRPNGMIKKITGFALCTQQKDYGVLLCVHNRNITGCCLCAQAQHNEGCMSQLQSISTSRITIAININITHYNCNQHQPHALQLQSTSTSRVTITINIT